MEFLINESQLKLILQEQDKSKMNEYMRRLYSFSNDLINKAGKKYGLNLKLLLTWGASMGGLIMPLDEYLKTGHLNITESQRILILIGVSAIFFYDNKRVLEEILNKIKENGLEDTFKLALSKAKELNEAFTNFLQSLNTSFGNSMDLIAYSFLIPIIADLQNLTSGTDNIENVAKIITMRLIASGVVIVTGEALTKVIRKILKRLK
jgi:hypothetical protein